MKVDQEEMNRWTVQLRWTGAHVRKAIGILLRRGQLDEDLSYHLMTASQRAGMVEDALIRAGADEPREVDRAAAEGKEGREGVPLENQVRIPCPALVETVLWERCQEQIAANKKQRTRNDRRHVWAGLMRCPICGRRMLCYKKTYTCDHARRREAGYPRHVSLSRQLPRL
jgi:hypothetical protein